MDHRSRKAGITMLILGIVILIVFILSMNTGVVRLSPTEVIQTLLGNGSDQQNLILFEFRLPRIVISILIGAGLAISGAILQGISHNPLADPGILGINAGAGLAVMLYFAYSPVTSLTSIFMLPILALAGAGAAALIIYFLSYKKDSGIAPVRMILTGIAVASGISSAMIVLTLRLTPDRYQFVANWLAGNISGASWKYVIALLPWIALIVPFVMYKARVLNVLELGDQTAKGLGSPINRERGWLIAAAVGVAGASVSVSGGIGFVGLIGPHVARKLVGPKHQVLLPTSALIGSLLVIAADMIGRIILQPHQIPTGIVVAIIGAPYFLYLLSRMKS